MRYKFKIAKLLNSFVVSSVLTLSCSAAERIEATYNFIWKGFHVSTAETVAEFTPNDYFLGIQVRTHGLLKMATRARGDIKVSGQILPNGRLQAREFSATGIWKGDPFLQKLEFEEDGDVAAVEKEWSDEWVEKNKREPIPDALKKGPDPTSLFVSLMQNPVDFTATETPINLRTYDGDTVVDWQLGCAKKPVKLKKSNHSPHHGKAYECKLGSTLVAGAKLEEDKSVRMKRGPRGRRRPVEVADNEEARVWLMALDETNRLLPVRAEVPSDQGQVNLYLKKLAVSGR